MDINNFRIIKFNYYISQTHASKSWLHFNYKKVKLLFRIQKIREKFL